MGVDWSAVANIKNELYDSDGEGDSDYSRGVTFGYLVDDGYLSDEYAEYAYEFTRQSNHQVTLVGWDDDYPAENFAAGFDESKKELHTPEGNGAWLVKNSWGSETGDSVDSQLFSNDWGIEENGKHTGYFWISYYDRTLCDWSTYDFDLDSSSSDSSRVIEQYDYLTSGVYTDLESYEKPCYQANVFTADCDTDIDTLTCWTAKPNTTVTFQVYLLDDAAQDPTDAERSKLAYTGEKTFSYGGYHRLELGEGERLAVREGQRYAVAILQHCEDDGRYYAVCKFNNRGCTQYGDEEADLTWAEDQSFYVLTRINPGESWFAECSDDGQASWSDWTKIAKETHDMLKENPEFAEYSYAFDNLPIKALGTKASYASVDELDKLKSELAAAKAVLGGAFVSADGSDVSVAERWMTQDDYDALKAAVEAAERAMAAAGDGYREELAAGTPSSEEVESLVASLKSASAKAADGTYDPKGDGDKTSEGEKPDKDEDKKQEEPDKDETGYASSDKDTADKGNDSSKGDTGNKVAGIAEVHKTSGANGSGASIPQTGDSSMQTVGILGVAALVVAAARAVARRSRS